MLTNPNSYTRFISIIAILTVSIFITGCDTQEEEFIEGGVTQSEIEVVTVETAVQIEITTIPSYEVPLPTESEVVIKEIQFCGNTADPDDAVVLSLEEALSYLALVNRCFRVSEDFLPDDLSIVDVASVNLNWGPHHLLRYTAARAVEEMFSSAYEDGLILLASSAHRTNDNQTFYFTSNVQRNGLAEAMRVSAVPGHSEHQLGLAVDITTHSLNGGLTQAFTETPEGRWVNQNAHRFGFIISYPQNREADTGFIYEPWHLRYVGVEVATEIFENGFILEEFLWHNK